MNEIPKRLEEAVQRLKQGEPPRRYRVRAVLKWFGAARRGANVLSDIKTAVAGLGLESEPPFDAVNIDDRVRFVLASAAVSDGTPSPEPVPQATAAPIDNTSEAETAPSCQPEVLTPSDDQLEPDQDAEQPIVKADDRPVMSQIRQPFASVHRQS